MSESSRNIHAAARLATKALRGYLEEDVEWTEVRTIALMLEGVVFVEAVSQAAEECSLRIIERKLQALERDQRADAQAKRQAEETERRSDVEARATLGQQPSLKASFGDLLAARKRA